MSAAEEVKNLKDAAAMLNDATGALQDWRGKNYGSEDAVRLRRLVRAWRDSGGNIGKMQIDQQDRNRLESFIENIGFRLESDGLNLTDYYPKTGRYDAAAMNFTRLIGNSQRTRLGGPCRHCGKWYVSKTQRETLFCSRKCAANAAKAAERKRRHDGLLRQVGKAIRNYQTRSPRFAEMEWKEFVTKAVYGVSKKWLTMATKNGEIVPPKEGR